MLILLLTMATVKSSNSYFIASCVFEALHWFLFTTSQLRGFVDGETQGLACVSFLNDHQLLMDLVVNCTYSEVLRAAEVCTGSLLRMWVLMVELPNALVQLQPPLRSQFEKCVDVNQSCRGRCWNELCRGACHVLLMMHAAEGSRLGIVMDRTVSDAHSCFNCVKLWKLLPQRFPDC